ncbi:MAG: hypothetical protein SVM79_09230, partial [Chloroflexota bacterium]|nr:hypothetical protein [Chloroflexota bacterium]
MKDEFTGNGTEDELTPAENRTPNSPDERVVNDDGGSRIATERLERVEAALELLLDHLETSTRGTEILEAEHSRSLLSSIALGFSAIALIALWSIDLARDDIDIDLIRFTIGMSFLLLASV